jgi:hypothetical protein
MGAGKPRVLACAGAAAHRLGALGLGAVRPGALGVGALGVALLVNGCVTMRSSPSSLAPGQTLGRATPTVTPQPVPVLGSMSYGTFPASTDGIEALTLCEQWAVLRDEYVARLRADTPYQLEQWFSSPVWHPAFLANNPLKTDPTYSQINTAFTLVSTGAAASVPNAELLDKACASAD